MSNKNILNLDLKDIFTNMVNNYLTENKIGKKIDRKTINLFNYDGISNNIENLDKGITFSNSLLSPVMSVATHRLSCFYLL